MKSTTAGNGTVTLDVSYVLEVMSPPATLVFAYLMLKKIYGMLIMKSLV